MTAILLLICSPKVDRTKITVLSRNRYHYHTSTSLKCELVINLCIILTVPSAMLFVASVIFAIRKHLLALEGDL